jgi:hypothetical protein
MKLVASVLVIVIAAPAAANPLAPDKAERKAPPPPPSPAASASGARRPSPPPVPPPARPAPEVAALGKELAGAWSCKGVALHGDGSSQPLQASLAIKLELDDAWLVTTLVEKAGPLRFTEYRTYDVAAKEWARIQLVNTSARVLSISPGERGGKWTWTGTATTPTGAQPVRDYEQRDGKQLRFWGEAQLDGAWQKTYDVTCKK